MERNELAAEHVRLKQETDALEQEHEELSRVPDPEGVLHAEHRRNLKHTIAELRAHKARLKSARRP